MPDSSSINGFAGFNQYEFKHERRRALYPGALRHCLERCGAGGRRLITQGIRSLPDQALNATVAAPFLVCIITPVLLKTLVKIAPILRVFSLPTARDPVHTGARAREIFCNDWIVMLLSANQHQRTLSER